MTLPRAKHKAERVDYLLLILAGTIGLIGYFGPWVPHKAVGLVILGLDLAEYVKFLPEVASGRIAIRREMFYMPLFAASVSSSLLTSRPYLPRWARCGLAIAAIPLALAILPPAWSPAVLQTPEFGLQAIAILVCLLLVPGILATRYLPDRLTLGIIALLALLAALWPAWGFLQARPAIADLYRQPLRLGWGFWASLLGFLAMAVLAVAEILRPRRTAP